MATKSQFDGATKAGGQAIPLRIELGRTQMGRQEALKLRVGAVVPLGNSTDGPVDIYAEGRLVARGEVLAVDGHLGVRIVELYPTRLEMRSSSPP
jgi:flagellar motor switch protein FliN